MNRVLFFAVLLLSAICGNLWLENREARADYDGMARLYDGMLNRKIGGGTFADRIVPNSLTVFRSKAGAVGCAILKEAK